MDPRLVPFNLVRFHDEVELGPEGPGSREKNPRVGVGDGFPFKGEGDRRPLILCVAVVGDIDGNKGPNRERVG